MTPSDKPRFAPRKATKDGGKDRKPSGRGEKPRPKPNMADETGSAPEPERISKLLARAGIASRRDVERMIAAGRVKLNGKVLDTPAVNVTLADRIEVDDVVVDGIERTRLWLYYKPAGLVTTNRDPEGRATIFARLPADLPRVMTIGRLDINTEGLLLLTNDGGLARVLELPTTGWLRRYRVRAHGDIDQDRLDELKDGIAVEGVLYGAIDAVLERKQGSNVWITMGLREGKNREIKNVLGALGLEVNRLIRVSYGPFQLADMAEGHVQEVRGRTLRDQLGPRLIEEAGADFDAPLAAHAAAPAAETKSPAAMREKREKPADRAERDRARLDTKRGDRPRDQAPGAKPASKKPGGPQRRRSANVWIAPGARPMGPKRAAEKAEAEARQASKDERQSRRRSGPFTSGATASEETAKPWRGRADGPARSAPGKSSRDKSERGTGAAKPSRTGRPDDGKRPGKPAGAKRQDQPTGGRPSGGARGPASDRSRGRPDKGGPGKGAPRGGNGKGRGGADRRR
ncbi:pseudouridine synthase [Pararhizobium haloflavum]|uniref:pseudouridine synthase n=1 Tax=Pararhizobium haloflavum TaxID=2037914 RepID=UPI000C189483|nr:pseudouridine synthase [Pararhizobium haloflavum]